MAKYCKGCKHKRKRRNPLKNTILSLSFLGFGLSLPFQANALTDYSNLGKLLGRNAEFQHYMDMPMRQKLTVAENNNLADIPAEDASNWTGCQIGKGILSGTARDISACAAAVYYGRDVELDEMAKLSYKEASKIIESIWNGIKASKIPDQDIANLVMHIQMHYGNLHILQKALNSMGAKLKQNGRMDLPTLRILVAQSFWAPTRTYNQIRSTLKSRYKKSPHRRAFLRALNREFPEKVDYTATFFAKCKNAMHSVITGCREKIFVPFRNVVAMV